MRAVVVGKLKQNRYSNVSRCLEEKDEHKRYYFFWGTNTVSRGTHVSEGHAR